jgi:hypothetical protein
MTEITTPVAATAAPAAPASTQVTTPVAAPATEAPVLELTAEQQLEREFGQTVDSPATDRTDEHLEEALDEAAEGEEGDKAKPKSDVQKRIDELTATAREAERRAAEAERLLGEATKSKEPVEAPAVDALGEEPDPADYEYGEADAKYIKDLTAYTVRHEHAVIENRRALETEFTKIEEGYNARVEAVAEKYPDFEDKVIKGAQGDNPTWVATPVMALAMKSADVGPDVAYHLATNPGESQRIAALSPLEQAREMGRLEGKFAFAEKAAPAPTPKIPGAPTPPSTLTRGAGGKFRAAADTDDFAAFEAAHGG